jgi:hypothetical protein
MGAGGQWAAGEGMADGAHGFRVVKISSGFRSCESFFNWADVVFGWIFSHPVQICTLSTYSYPLRWQLRSAKHNNQRDMG